MQKCKNDPERTYKGNEPSPKGLGYCAHAEKLGSKKKGNDGNIWIVNTVNGSKRWVKYSKESIWKSYNKFEIEPSKVPRNVIKKRLTNNQIKKYCGEKKNTIKIDKPEESKLYFTSFRGKYNVRYIAYIGKNNIAYIYKIAKNDLNTYLLEDAQGLKSDWKKWRKTITKRYTELVGKYEFINKFITDDVILLQLNKNKYLLIWENIIEFEIEDTIKEFYAPVPGSYAIPYAFSDNFLYLMVEYPIIKIPIEHFKHLKTKTDKENAYQSMFGHRDATKIIQKKINKYHLLHF